MNFSYKLFTNETIDLSRDYCHFSDGYRAGAHMKLAYQGTVTAATPQHALEELFRIFNIAHPADYRAHSLSVGDVVVLTDESGTETPWGCANFGWDRLEKFDPTEKNPAWIDSDEYFANQDRYENIRRSGAGYPGVVAEAVKDGQK